MRNGLLRHQALSGNMQFAGTSLGARSTCGNAVSMKAGLNTLGAASLRLSEAKVVVGRDVQGARSGAGQNLALIPVGAVAIEDPDSAPSDASGGLVEAFQKASLEPPSVERVEVSSQWCKPLERSRP